MITPQQVTEAFVKNDLETMMDAVRYVAERAPQPLVIHSPSVYAAHILHELGNKEQEEFWLTTMNNAAEIIQTHHLYTGTAYAAVLRISEIARYVILDNATAFIVAHNHPGGQQRIQPSTEDIGMSRKLYQVGLLIGVPMMDHVIVGRGQWYSMAEHNLLVEEKNNVRKNQTKGENGRPRLDGTSDKQLKGGSG
jgi:DNA repair protein RadC